MGQPLLFQKSSQEFNNLSKILQTKASFLNFVEIMTPGKPDGVLSLL